MIENIVSIVWQINIILIGLVVSFAILVALDSMSLSFLNFLQQRKIQLIENKIEQIHSLDSSSIPRCGDVVKISSDDDIFELLHENPEDLPDAFFEKLRHCLSSTGRITKFEKEALKARRKWERIEAIVVLGYLKSETSIKPLAQCLNDEDSDVVYYATLSLGKIQEPETAAILLQAISVLGINGQKVAALLEHFSPAIKNVLLEKLDHEDSKVRYWALKILSRHTDDADMVRILPLLKDESADVRAAACQALVGMASLDKRAFLRECLRDQEWFVRMYAVRALSNVLQPSDVTIVGDLLEDSSWFVKDEVRKVIAGNVSLFKELILKNLQSEKRAVRLICVNALISSGYIPTIINGLLSDVDAVCAPSRNLFDRLIDSEVYFGLRWLLERRPDDEKRRILAMVEEKDTRLAAIIAERLSLRSLHEQ